MPVWPPSLPQKPLVNGYADKLPSNLLRSSMDAGPAKVRRRGNAKPRQTTCVYVLNDTERDVLEAFLNDTLSGGAVCFDWPHPTLESDVRARVVPQGEDELASFSPHGTTLSWDVTLTLEYWPDAPLT